MPSILHEQPSAPTGDDKGHQSTDFPAVPVLRSPPPFGLNVQQTLPHTELMNISNNVTSVSHDVSGPEVIYSSAADTACNALINVPSTRTGTPKLLSKPGSALAQGLP